MLQIQLVPIHIFVCGKKSIEETIMTIGTKFLERVLNEGRIVEAKKDVDGFKDNFDITTLPPTSPAVANLAMPLARQVVQLYHLMGVSVETLEMRPKAVKEAAMEVADEMRTNRPLRLAAQRLFSVIATAKGFARKEEEVMEATASMAPEKEMQLIGSTIVKQMEAVLAALKLPSGVLQRAMRRDQQSMMETAEIIRSGAARSKFMMLASELGVDVMSINQTVKVTEAEAVGTQPTISAGQGSQQASVYEQAAQDLLAALGVNVKQLPASVRTKMAVVQRGDRGVATENSMIIRLMGNLTARLNKQGRSLQ